MAAVLPILHGGAVARPAPAPTLHPAVYQALLTRRYLTSKVMPLLAALAVMLCVAMELIVWSVMGGFLVMLVNSGRTLIGDVSISYQHTGFAYYDDLIRRLEADPMVEAATPMIESFGLLSLPLGGGAPETVIIKGIDGPSFDRVTGYAGTLWWRPLETPLPKDKDREDPRLDPQLKGVMETALAQGRVLTATSAPVAKGELDLKKGGRAALVIGIELGGYNDRLPSGVMIPVMDEHRPLLLSRPSLLSVLPMDRRGRALPGEQKTISIPVVNQFRSGLYEIDANTVLMRLDALQRLLLMDAAQREAAGGGPPTIRVDPKTGKEVFDEGPPTLVTEPARVTNVLVRAKKGIDAVALRGRCEQVYGEFAKAHAGQIGAPPPRESMKILTWRERNKTLISAVEHETVLVLFIFGVISLTSVFLVLAIFWSMVSEKTKDVGILRAIGASRAGVAWIWIRYGLGIGIVGALLGGAASWLIVANINPIHDWLGRTFNLVIWDPKVYYFTAIPNDLDWLKAVIVMASGVLASVIGALVPAVKAANMDPVRALRWE
jgi:lipoprotein-releasing system permease protein